MGDWLDELKARRAAISPAPWKLQGHPSETTMVYDAEGDSVVYNEGSPNERDAEFIAHAPSDIDRLIAEVERLRQEVNERDGALHYPPTYPEAYAKVYGYWPETQEEPG
jgi:hypothetical protein